MNNATKNPWLLFVLISLILSVIWFFSDLKNTSKIQIITEDERKIAEPMPAGLNLELIELFANRLNIDEAEISSTPPYASISRSSIEQQTNQSTTSQNTNSNTINTNSQNDTP